MDWLSQLVLLVVALIPTALIAYFKFSLDKLAKSYAIRFTGIYADRARAIRELYEKLVDLEISLDSYTTLFIRSGEAEFGEKGNRVTKDAFEFYKFYSRSKIFFPPLVCKLIEELYDIVRSDVVIRGIVIGCRTYDDLANHPEGHEHLKEMSDSVKQKIPPIKQQIEAEFRTLLGTDLV